MRQLGVHTVLLFVGLVLAYRSGNDEGEHVTSAKPVLAQMTLEQLSEVTYRWPKGTIRVHAIAVQGGGWSVELEKQSALPTKKKTPDDGMTISAVAPLVFPGGNSVNSAAEKMAPFEAMRSLGVVSEELVKSMGLQNAERRMQIRGAKKTWDFEIGDQTYGARGRYARRVGEDEVFLVDSSVFRGLEGTEKTLMETRLLPFDLEQIVSISLSRGDKNQKFLHIEREQRTKSHFVRETQPDTKIEEFSGFLRKTQVLRAQRYLQPAEEIPQTDLVLIIRAKFADGHVRELSLLKSKVGDTYFARRSRWVAQVSVAQARGLVDDVAALF